MAYSALISLAQTLDQILDDYHHSLSLHEKNRFISIQKYVLLLQSFLEEFPDTARALEGRMRDAANEAENVIEYFLWEEIQSSLRATRIGIRTKLRRFLDIRKLQKLTKDLDFIAAKVMEIKDSFRIDQGEHQPIDFSDAAVISVPAPIGKDDVVGLNDDLMAIKVRLCGESSKLQVISVVGMGGIGKTTLVRNVYHDILIVDHFDIRVWITVSQNSTQRCICSILKSSLNAASEEDVYKTLKGRRYLIVMDDIWCVEAWDEVRRLFPDDNNGSRIVFTTRLLDVAVYVESSSPHEVQLMDVDQSWNLLQKKVFAQEDCPPELETIGKRIAESCRGLPLAIVVIGGVLLTVEKTPTSWQKIADNIIVGVAADDEHFTCTMLSLSYHQLPQHLRQCFLYLAAFPDMIHVSRLIRMWVAEGFLKPSDSKSFEEIAEECLEDLVKRSLVMVNERKVDGKIKTCSIHDLILELCLRKAQEDKFLLLHERLFIDIVTREIACESVRDARRISIQLSSFLDDLTTFYGSAFRSIIYFGLGESSLDFLKNLRLLRVLDVVDMFMFSDESIRLPHEVFQLFHLRYIAIDCRTKIPAAISNLQNLQTLVIHPRKFWKARRLTSLPPEIWELPQLRHLMSYCFDFLPSPARASLSLKNLQTLSEVREFQCTVDILKRIPNLKNLGILYTDTKYIEEYSLNNLVFLHQLQRLKLSILSSYPFQLRQKLVFPSTLKRLTLSDTQLSWADMTAAVGLLPNLEALKLRDFACHDSKWVTSEGEFAKLKLLLIDKSHLQHWITASSHFQRLKCLRLYHCYHLQEIPEDIGEIPTLELIEIDHANKTLLDSARSIKEEQESCGNNVLRVHVVHFQGLTVPVPVEL